MAAVQRFRQGIRALFAFSKPVEYALANQYLNTAQLELFRRMKRSEQLHSLNVLRDVLAQSPTPDDLALAALLHDVGKTRYPLQIWQKTLAVLLRVLAPRMYQYGSRQDPRSFWARALVVAEQHPLWSAEIVRSTGASEVAIWLIEHHSDPLAKWTEHPHAGLLKRLRQADDAN